MRPDAAQRFMDSAFEAITGVRKSLQDATTAISRLEQENVQYILDREQEVTNRTEQAIKATDLLDPDHPIVGRFFGEDRSIRFRPETHQYLRQQLKPGSFRGKSQATAGRSRPETFASALKEWDSLAPQVVREIRDLFSACDRWERRAFKTKRSRPEIRAGLAEDLKHLDDIEAIIPDLRAEYIDSVIDHAADLAKKTHSKEVLRQQDMFQEARARMFRKIETHPALGSLPAGAWNSTAWLSPAPVDQIETAIRLGCLRLDLPLEFDALRVPALTSFPFETGLAIESVVETRDQSLGLVRSLMLRVLAATPPGEVQITVIDPVSLGGTVAEFRHLSDFDSRLMDEKTWTSERDIDRVIDGLSAHVEIVISKYLKGQFATIADYNQNAGEVAEPYRLLVVFDYPAGFSARAAQQLLGLIENGPRCGVFTVLHHTATKPGNAPPSHDITIDRLTNSMQKVVLRQHGSSAELTTTKGRPGLPFLPDPPPEITFDSDGNPLTPQATLLASIGEAVQRQMAKPQAVTLETLLPVLARSRTGTQPDYLPNAAPLSTDSSTWWQATTATSALALLGRSGAQGAASLYFSSIDIAGGAIMVGLPRSGKTTSLHSVVMTMAMLYSPEEVELYLVDGKHGVEFKAYADLPHARMVSVHSEREFSLAVLQDIDAEIRRRAETMKAAGAANITHYRKSTGQVMPRIVLVMDEFHELFEQQDKVGEQAFDSFSNIVRMGPFAGVHIILASQTLSAIASMDRPTLLLLPERVAFMCNEFDSDIVMGPDNRATRALSKAGEGIFNPAGGDEARNQQFQGLFIPPEERSELLQHLREKADRSGWTRAPRVFDGDAVVPRPSIRQGSGRGTRLTIALGEPFSLAEAESITLRRARGSHIMILGDGEDATDLAARGALHSCLLTASEHGAHIAVVDFMGEELDADRLSLEDLSAQLDASFVRSSRMVATFVSAAKETVRRVDAADYRSPTQVLVLYGLQRATSLIRFDPFALSDDDAPVDERAVAGQALATVVTNGPEVGIHVIVVADHVRSVQRRIGTELDPEFVHRVVGSAADQADLAYAGADYTPAQKPRVGQLLVGNVDDGTSARIRGYAPLTPEERITSNAGQQKGEV